MFSYSELTAKEKITRAKIHLGNEKPFWAYLLLNAEIREEQNDELKEMGTIGACSDGKIIYRPDFINSLSEKELRGVLAHEIFHIAFRHIDRLKTLKSKSKDGKLWNISADMIVNNTLLNEGFSLVDGGVLPKHNKWEGLGFKVEEIHKKSVEQIYTELSSQIKKKPNTNFGKGDGRGDKADSHLYKGNGNKKGDLDKKGRIKQQNNNNNKDWEKILSEGYTHAKQRGNTPKGMKGMIADLLNPEINWRDKLQKHILKNIPNDFTYQKPSKRSLASGFYLPASKKENLDLIVGIDVSGSISKSDYDKFISEVIGIAKSYESVKLRVITWGTKVWENLEFSNGNIEKIKNMKMGRWDGTEINCLLKEVNELNNMNKVLVVLTDGYFGRIKEQIRQPVIWVLTENNTESHINEGEIVRLRGN